MDLSKQQALDTDPRAIHENVLYYCRIKRNCFGLFTRNAESFANAISLERKYSLIFINIKVTQQLKCKTIKFTVHKFKSAIKNEAEVVLRLSSTMTGDDETNFPHKLLLTTR